MFEPDITQSVIQTFLKGFLVSILPEGVKVNLGQVNRVPEPKEVNHIIFWPIRKVRLDTNTHRGGDVCFVGSSSGDLLTVTSIVRGEIVVGAWLFGVGVAAGTKIKSLVTGSGGVGTYRLSITQSLSARTLSAGNQGAAVSTEVVFQVDVHGPNSSNNAQTISTLMRDSYGVSWFNNFGTGVVPLFAEDPVQTPFSNAENQYEDRWVVETHIQANIAVLSPQEYADIIVVGLKEIDSTYPPLEGE